MWGNSNIVQPNKYDRSIKNNYNAHTFFLILDRNNLDKKKKKQYARTGKDSVFVCEFQLEYSTDDDWNFLFCLISKLLFFPSFQEEDGCVSRSNVVIHFWLLDIRKKISIILPFWVQRMEHSLSCRVEVSQLQSSKKKM